MRRLYLDTSLLVAALVHETGTDLASALALQVRRGAITLQESQKAWQRFGVLRAHRLQALPLVVEDFEAAARLCLAQVPPLRAGDALHLALCQRLNLQLASFDLGLAAYIQSNLPFSERQGVDHPVSLYAASKKANELLRFFAV